MLRLFKFGVCGTNYINLAMDCDEMRRRFTENFRLNHKNQTR